MRIPVSQAILIIAVVAVVTLFTRAVPFLFFGGKRGMPRTLRQISEKLPPAIIAILVVYCVKDALTLTNTTLPATLIALTLVTVLHLWRRNTLLSIAAGTLTYMLLLHLL